jgi:hypothetical protein
VDDYGGLLRQQRQVQLRLADMDFDTGRETRAGEYSLADKTYAHLLNDLAKRDFDQATPQLRQNILSFYSDPNAPITTKKNSKAWRTAQEELEKLKVTNPDHSVNTASTITPVNPSLP